MVVVDPVVSVAEGAVSVGAGGATVSVAGAVEVGSAGSVAGDGGLVVVGGVESGGGATTGG